MYRLKIETSNEVLEDCDGRESTIYSGNKDLEPNSFDLNQP